ncbi:hypothetical protein H5410_058949 [Solanum commersonii]|uniref:Uncharacterized protein n=1 Tax=Solanum commersonii TaxID=4109 RepID=A0A9J5W1D9_SOLCO|nr:hypothetical protein H5410_058949 [Solanum commersonii]
MTTEIRITKISMDYSTRKWAKRGVYTLRGSFDLGNWPIFSSCPIGSITKVLTDIHEKFQQK